MSFTLDTARLSLHKILTWAYIDDYVVRITWALRSWDLICQPKNQSVLGAVCSCHMCCNKGLSLEGVVEGSWGVPQAPEMYGGDP